LLLLAHVSQQIVLQNNEVFMFQAKPASTQMNYLIKICEHFSVFCVEGNQLQQIHWAICEYALFRRQEVLESEK